MGGGGVDTYKHFGFYALTEQNYFQEYFILYTIL